MNRDATADILAACANGQVKKALEMEAHLYSTLVKTQETEEHYRECFQRWAGDMRNLALRMAANGGSVPAKGKSVAVFLHSNSQLAHFQILKTLIANSGNRNITAFVLADEERISGELGVPVVPIGANLESAFPILQLEMRERNCGTLVWVSVPLYASYALSYRLAERQVYWALRFHSVTVPEIDCYLSYGHRGETSRTYHGQRWETAHAPLSVAPAQVSVEAAERHRAEFGFGSVIGTVARDEKIANPDYLEAVAQVLAAEPDTLFLWTGKKENPAVRSFFAARGLSRQHRYLGWVDPDKCIELMDVFLETFPQGGVMTWLAMARGVPVVGMKRPGSVYGWLQDAPAGSCSATDLRDYAAHALSLLRSRQRHAEAVRAGRMIYENERVNVAKDCERMWGLIDG